MALHHSPVFADKKVIIGVLCVIQFVVYSMRNPVVYRTAKKVVFCQLFKLLCKFGLVGMLLRTINLLPGI